MRYGYARVSKNEQRLDVQIQKLTAAGCDEILSEKISGAKDDRPKALTNDKAETIRDYVEQKESQ